MELDLTNLVGRQESTSSLVRFEDETDANAPRLNYSVPLPGLFQGKFYIEIDFFNDQLPWTAAARENRTFIGVINNFVGEVEAGRNPNILSLDEIATLPRSEPRLPNQSLGSNVLVSDISAVITDVGDSERRENPALVAPISSQPRMMRVNDTIKVVFGQSEVSLDEIASKASQGKVPVFYRTFGGNLELDYLPEAEGPEEANPRFLIIEHYRLYSFFGDYGAGKTVGVFSLMPGEETTLYIRNWRRTEDTIKEASSIFDSFTSEAADEFEVDLQSEITNKQSQSKNRQVHSSYSGSGEINLGLGKVKLNTKHSGELTHDNTTTSARETVTKNTAKVTSKHSSKASSKRTTEVTQELEKKTEQEFERITERKIANTNLSRTLNIVTRELNQEFKTYFALTDVTLAFTNDLNVFEFFQVHQIDEMLEKYIAETETGGLVDDLVPITPSKPFGTQQPRKFVRDRLLQQISEVYDFRGTRHEFLEEVTLSDDGEEIFPLGQAPADRDTYYRVRRARDAESTNPFYEPGEVPVEGIVMNESKYTLRTPAVIIDALLGHGVALDNYALGLQQETLREKQLENRKVEVALELIETGNTEVLEAYRQIFGSVDNEL
jgi:hypothetical protein